MEMGTRIDTRPEFIYHNDLSDFGLPETCGVKWWWDGKLYGNWMLDPNLGPDETLYCCAKMLYGGVLAQKRMKHSRLWKMYYKFRNWMSRVTR